MQQQPAFICNNRPVFIPPPGREPPRSAPMAPALAALMNKTEPGFIVYAHFVPTRVIRVTAHQDFIRFRVERLILTSKPGMPPIGNWKTLKALSGKLPGEMLNQAMQEAYREQVELVKRLQKRQESRKILRA